MALDGVQPSARARELGVAHERKDPRAVQVVLDQSAEVLRAERGVLICRTHHGFVCANAGVDASNAEPGTLVVLPRDPDASARRIRAGLRELTGARRRRADHRQLRPRLAPRPARRRDRARRHAAAGRLARAHRRRGLQLRATWLAVADAVAALADLARAKDSREPVVIVDGLERFVTADDGPGAAALLRALDEDLFR